MLEFVLYFQTYVQFGQIIDEFEANLSYLIEEAKTLEQTAADIHSEL